MRAFVVAVVLAGCGDNDACKETSTTLPAEGPLADPYSLPLENCVGDGLANATGRWFLADPTTNFEFSYPQLTGSCTVGIRNPAAVTNGDTEYSWSDGTIYFHRRWPIRGTDGDYARVSAVCAQPDGTLAGVSAYEFLFPSAQPAYYKQRGKRFWLRDDPAKGLALVGSLATRPDGSAIAAYNLVVDGNDAFLVGPRGLDIVDISGPPRFKAHLDEPLGYNDVKLLHRGDKRYAFVAPFSGPNTIVVDVTDPSAPAIVTIMTVYSHSIFIDEATARMYLADYSQGVPQYDVADPLTPRLLAIAPVAGPDWGIHDLFVDGDTLYVNDTENGIVALDTSGAFSRPRELGRIKTSYSHGSWVGVAGGRKIVLAGDEGMTGTDDGGAFLRILDGDRTSPTYFQEIARYQSRPQVGIHYFKMLGDRAYIAYYQDGVRVLDLSDPTKPREIAHYNTWDPVTAPGGPFEGALGIYLANGLIYVADSEKGLLILRETL